ncbi:lethal neighbour of tid [Nannochloropsis oceanica]
MCLLYAAVLFFSTNKWARGCLLYSLAVSVKMNILLFAPGLALLLLQALGPWGAVLHIFLCGLVQLLVAYPFLYHHPIAYLSKVLLPPSLPPSLPPAFPAFASISHSFNSPSLPPSLPLSPAYVVYTLFVSNFLGVAFARTLHYQFYACRW